MLNQLQDSGKINRDTMRVTFEKALGNNIFGQIGILHWIMEKLSTLYSMAIVEKNHYLQSVIRKMILKYLYYAQV
jgi:hypothetical protein